MPKDYAKFVPPKENTESNGSGRLGVVLFAIFVLSISVVISYFLYENKVTKIPGQRASLSGFLEYAASSVLHRRAKPIISENKNKKIVQNAENSPVQFDFYNELPNMQMSVSDDEKANTQNVKVASSSDDLVPKENPSAQTSDPSVVDITPISQKTDTLATANDSPEQNVTDVSNEETTVQAKKSNEDKLNSLFDPEQVSRELDSEVNKPIPVAMDNSRGKSAKAIPAEEQAANQYVLQLGSFESEAGAKRLQEALLSVGFNTQVIEKKIENVNHYVVQQGPYESKDIAKSSQQRLQKRGIVSILRTL